MHKTITRYPTVFRDDDGRTWAILMPPACPACGNREPENIVHDPRVSDTWLCRKCSEANPGDSYAGVWDTRVGDSNIYIELPMQCPCPYCYGGKMQSRINDRESIAMICDACETEYSFATALVHVDISEFETCGTTEEKPVIVQNLTAYERESLLEGLLERMRVAYHDLQPMELHLSDIHLMTAAINCVQKMREPGKLQ